MAGQQEGYPGFVSCCAGGSKAGKRGKAGLAGCIAVVILAAWLSICQSLRIHPVAGRETVKVSLKDRVRRGTVKPMMSSCGAVAEPWWEGVKQMHITRNTDTAFAALLLRLVCLLRIGNILVVFCLGVLSCQHFNASLIHPVFS